MAEHCASVGERVDRVGSRHECASTQLSVAIEARVRNWMPVVPFARLRPLPMLLNRFVRLFDRDVARIVNSVEVRGRLIPVLHEFLQSYEYVSAEAFCHCLSILG